MRETGTRGLRWLVVIALMIGILSSAQAVEIMTWDRTPLSIELPVGKERLVILDRNVRVGLPRPIADPAVLRVQSAGGVMYLRASEAFDTQRVQLQDAETGEMLLVDLTAAEGAPDEDIRVVPANLDSRELSEGESGQSTASVDSGERRSNTPTPVALIRYAAQSLYSPLRTIESLPGVARTPMRLPRSLPELLPALPVDVAPVAAWTLDGWTVTAVSIANRDTSRTFELDPRWFQGHFYSAGLMHPDIGPHGSAYDTTTVFLVTHGGGLRDAMYRGEW